MNETNFAVTVTRLPESLLDELETHVAEIHDEYDLDPDQVGVLQGVIIGYGAAWDAVESLQQQVNQLTTERDEFWRMVKERSVELTKSQ